MRFQFNLKVKNNQNLLKLHQNSHQNKKLGLQGQNHCQFMLIMFRKRKNLKNPGKNGIREFQFGMNHRQEISVRENSTKDIIQNRRFTMINLQTISGNYQDAHNKGQTRTQNGGTGYILLYNILLYRMCFSFWGFPRGD
jgi:hypothetical protein